MNAEGATMEPVADILAGKRLLLTGGTGFLGMYMVAKLLKDVPKLAGLVLPVRGGAGKDPQARWKASEEAEELLFRGCDLSKIFVLPIEHITDVPAMLDKHAGQIGPIHGIFDTLGDSSMAGYNDMEDKIRINATAPQELYEAARHAPPGHPLATVEGFVQTTTIGVVEIGPPTGPGGNRTVECKQRPHPVHDTAPDEMFFYKMTGAYGLAKRMVETRLMDASSSANGRFIPVSIVRPGLIMGVSDLPGIAAPTGWSNKGNINYPMSYYFFSGQPNKETEPKLKFLPPRYWMERGAGACDPVDICCNHHCGALALLLAHKDRMTYKGPDIPTFNSCHDQKIRRFSMWEYLNSFPHFDEKNYSNIDHKTVALLQKSARLIGGEEGESLRKELQRLKRVYLYFPVKGKATGSMKERPELTIHIDNHHWLERQMHPSDRDKFPVTFTDRMNFNECIRLAHDYTWQHVLTGQRAQQNVVQRNAKSKAKAKL